MEVKTIYKNYLVMSLSFFMLFVSFNGTQTLQRQAIYLSQTMFSPDFQYAVVLKLNKFSIWFTRASSNNHQLKIHS